MQADYSIELGHDDPALELPWRSEDGTVCFHDLKADPSLIALISEAAQYPELRYLLLRLNAPGTPLQTAKCDVWSTREISFEEESFCAEWKHSSYIDLLFERADQRMNLGLHQQFAREICALLSRAPDIAASIELIIRRCHYWIAGETSPEHAYNHSSINSTANEGTEIKPGTNPGFYFTVYVNGFGQHQSDAQQKWAIACELTQNAIMQAAATKKYSAQPL